MTGGTPRQEHWDRIHRQRAAESTSWYQARPEASLRALDHLGAGPGDSLIDAGGGRARLVDVLLERGWTDLAVLDIAPSALEEARRRLGPRAAGLRWIAADVTRWQPDRIWTIWHDRALFHFLTAPEDRAAYRRAMTDATGPGSGIILATFAPEGPERCSGLPVQRWDADGLACELGPLWSLQAAWREGHRSPSGAMQIFQWAVFRRAGGCALPPGTFNPAGPAGTTS